MSQTFAQNLKAYRQLARMTQQDLATSTGVTRSAINNYEAGKSEPSFEALCHISDILGVSLTDLVTDHEIPDYARRELVTDDESAVLQAYREADPVYQSVALDILRSHRRIKDGEKA